jgi:beta-glucuronidase
MSKYNFGTMSGQSLAEGWGVLPDPMGRCRRQQWWRKTRRANEWFPSYDDDAFWPTTVPGAFTRLHPNLEYYEGEAVYLNHFLTKPVDENEKVFLHFEGVAERADVFLNGHYLGRIQTGFTPATFDVTAELAERNRLMVIVDNKRRPGDVPGEMHDWWQDGGIVRPVQIYRRPANVHAREAAVETRLLADGQVELTFRVLLDAPTRDAIHAVSVELSAAPGGERIAACSIAARPGAWHEARVALPREQAPLWSCETPQLCELRMSVGADLWRDTVGLREIRTSGRELLLNGKTLVLRGINSLTDDPVRGAITTSDETARKILAAVRELNANFVRGHRPFSCEFIRACDVAGVLVWQETPAYWLPSMAEPCESRHALENLAGMVCDFRNSPSVILWSVGNECLSHNRQTGPSNLAYFLEAADFLRREDPTRLVTYTGGLEGNHDLNFLNEVFPRQIADMVDVVSFNSYAGIDEGAYPETTDTIERLYQVCDFASGYGKPVIHAEAGIDSVPGETSFDYGEERGAEYHRKLQKYFAAQTAAGRLQGMAIFVLCDYQSPIKHNRHQRGYNRKGLLTATWQRKAAYHVVREGYATE